MASEKSKVFLSYAHEDFHIAKRLYDDLKAEGVNVWFDEENLLGGMNVKHVIKENIRDSSYFIALLSTKSVAKKGFIQKELKEALDILGEFPVSDIFVIPVRIEKCIPINHEIKNLKWIDMFEDWSKGLKSILRVVKSQNRRSMEVISDQSIVGYGTEVLNKQKTVKKSGVIQTDIPDCPICGSSQYTVRGVYQMGVSELRECNGCGQQYWYFPPSPYY